MILIRFGVEFSAKIEVVVYLYALFYFGGFPHVVYFAKHRDAIAQAVACFERKDVHHSFACQKPDERWN